MGNNLKRENGNFPSNQSLASGFAGINNSCLSGWMLSLGFLGQAGLVSILCLLLDPQTQ